MATFAERLIEALKIRRMSPAELSRKIDVDEGTISNYKKGKYEPKQKRTQVIANVLNVSIDWLMGADVPMEKIDNIIPLNKARRIPIIGEIACGEPILAQENWEDLILLPNNISADFALKCKGDSMINARINDGDVVYIKQQDQVDNGEIAAVLIENEATLKRVYIYNDKLVLQPENVKYSPLVYLKEEMNNIRILGKAVGFTSIIKK
ncbi:LexA family transcriptional regulator [Eubacterium sp.]